VSDVLFSELSDIPRLREIAAKRDFSRPVRMLLIKQVEAQLKEIARLKSAECPHCLRRLDAPLIDSE
jgi:hypothetical protein